MQDKSHDVSGWFAQFQCMERDSQQLTDWSKTTLAFCNAAETAASETPFESEPSQFYTLLQDLAPEVLKK